MNHNSYKMRLSLSILEHLGLNLYSNLPAVISETVANAWDADATKVLVEISKNSHGEQIVTITDDGVGMTVDDANDKFLVVGYQRRKQEPVTQKGRNPMGRKGIGKLSLFSIAEEIEVHSRKGDEQQAFLLEHRAIKEAIENDKNSDAIYEPKSIDFKSFGYPQGTRIVIRKLKKRVNLKTASFLRKRIARRFGISCINDMEIWVKDAQSNEKVSINDREYFKKLELILLYGDDDYKRYRNTDIETEERENQVIVTEEEKETQYEIRGWIGFAKETPDLTVDGESINKISIMTRNKLGLEDFLPEVAKSSSNYTKYLIGEIYADFLDMDEEEDIATSSRQNFIEDDPRFQSLKKFLIAEIRHAGTKWNQMRSTKGMADATSLIPPLEEWYDKLPKDTQEFTKVFLGDINSSGVEGEQKNQMYANAVFAIEYYQAKRMLKALKELDVNLASKLFKYYKRI